MLKLLSRNLVIVNHAEPNLVKLFASGDTSVVYKHKIEVEWQTDTQREAAGGARVSWISSKRNRTIGFGERDQIDVVTESVIRWASCTHIPTAPSLRLSLVC